MIFFKQIYISDLQFQFEAVLDLHWPLSEDNDQDADDDTGQSDGTANHDPQSLVPQETVRALGERSYGKQDLTIQSYLSLPLVQLAVPRFIIKCNESHL